MKPIISSQSEKTTAHLQFVCLFVTDSSCKSLKPIFVWAKCFGNRANQSEIPQLHQTEDTRGSAVSKTVARKTQTERWMSALKARREKSCQTQFGMICVFPSETFWVWPLWADVKVLSEMLQSQISGFWRNCGEKKQAKTQGLNGG